MPRNPTVPLRKSGICPYCKECRVEYGKCHCGCGGDAPRAPQSIKKLNIRRGEPYKYISQHGTRHLRESFVHNAENKTSIIPLTNGKSAIIDTKNFERISQHVWAAWTDHTSGRWYAVRNGTKSEKRKRILMHREILNAPDGYSVDHRNGDGLINTEENLRIATQSQNSRNHKLSIRNTSGQTGVYWWLGKWRACIVFNGKTIHIGSFSEFREAVQARREKELELFGEFSSLYRKKR